MSGLHSGKSDREESAKVAAFRGPGRAPESSTAGFNDPIIITTNAQFIDPSSLTRVDQVDDVEISSPPRNESRRLMGEKSIKRQVDRGHTGNSSEPTDISRRPKVKLLGPGGASVLTSIDSAVIETKISMVSLYGGAMQCVMPSGWRDVSEVRQVPDHQEVWQDCTVPPEPDGSVRETTWLDGANGCVIFEILDRQDDVTDKDAPAFFFEDLADSNGAEGDENVSIDWQHVYDNGSVVDVLPGLRGHDGTTTICALEGRQRVVAEGAEAAEWVRIGMVVLRLEALQTDLVISYSKEIDVDESVGMMKIAGGVGGGVGGGGGSGGGADENSAELPFGNVFKLILETFKMNDWTLFC
jgi:hypothetical protein